MKTPSAMKSEDAFGENDEGWNINENEYCRL